MSLKDTYENDELVKQVARKLARFHHLDVPLDKKETKTVSITDQYYSRHDPATYKKFLAALGYPDWKLPYDVKEELEWGMATEKKIPARLVRTHGDANKNNIMVREVPDKFGEKMMLVDFEGGCWASRGRDLGTFFTCLTLEMNGKDLWICQEYPTEEWRRMFLQEYLDQVKQLTNDFDEKLDNVDQLLFESEFFSLMVGHFFVGFFHNQELDSYLLKDKTVADSQINIHNGLGERYLPQKQRFLEKYADKLK